MSEWIFGFVLGALVLEAMPRLRLRVRAFLMRRETRRAIESALPVDAQLLRHPSHRLDLLLSTNEERFLEAQRAYEAQCAAPVDEKAVEYWPPATRLDVWKARQAERKVKP